MECWPERATPTWTANAVSDCIHSLSYHHAHTHTHTRVCLAVVSVIMQIWHKSLFFFLFPSCSPTGPPWLEEVLCGSEGDDLVSPEGTASRPLLRCHRNTQHPPPQWQLWWMLLAALLCSVCLCVCVSEREWARALKEEMRHGFSSVSLSPPAGRKAALATCSIQINWSSPCCCAIFLCFSLTFPVIDDIIV